MEISNLPETALRLLGDESAHGGSDNGGDHVLTAATFSALAVRGGQGGPSLPPTPPMTRPPLAPSTALSPAGSSIASQGRHAEYGGAVRSEQACTAAASL